MVDPLPLPPPPMVVRVVKCDWLEWIPVRLFRRRKWGQWAGKGGLSCCSTGSGWLGCSPGGPHLGSGPEHQLHSGAHSWGAS